MSQPTLMADPRSVVGKKVKRLRAGGLVPGVIYGPGLEETVQVSVDEKTFTKFYYAHGHSTLLKLTCDGQNHQVLIRDVQLDPVKKNPLHVDFFAPNLKKEINAAVPLALHGEVDGPGIFTHLISEVQVHGLPGDIPPRLVVDLSALKEEGDTIRVGDLEVPENVSIVTHAEEVIAMLAAQPVEPVEEEEEAAEEAEGEEAAAEGEEAETSAAGSEGESES
jgi:large subunit ribosomal protein L25